MLMPRRRVLPASLPLIGWLVLAPALAAQGDTGAESRPTASQPTASQPSGTPATEDRRSLDFAKAAKVSADMAGLAVLVYRGDELLFEDYQNGHTQETPHHLFSGTKSFAPILALIAAEKGLLKLDEPVHETISEWSDDEVRSQIRIRHLLDFTSGLEINDRVMHNPRTEDWYGTGLAAKGEHPPGKRFRYGSCHLMVFGELLKRKLAANVPEGDAGKAWPRDFAQATERWILEPIGAQAPRWLRDQQGNPAVPFGAYMTARDWGRFGRLLLREGKWGDTQVFPGKRLAECLKGSRAQPAYGLNFWILKERIQAADAELPLDTYMAVGMYTQVLYIIPSEDLVVVRFGRIGARRGLGTRRFHRPFLEALFAVD